MVPRQSRGLLEFGTKPLGHWYEVVSGKTVVETTALTRHFVESEFNCPMEHITELALAGFAKMELEIRAQNARITTSDFFEVLDLSLSLSLLFASFSLHSWHFL
jgi:hypothetical protein